MTAFCHPTLGDGRGARGLPSPPTRWQESPSNSRASASTDMRVQGSRGGEVTLALKSPEQSEPASSAACRKIYFVVIEKAVSRRKGEEKRN